MVYQWHGLLWDHTQWRVDCERCVVHLGASERRAGWPGRATELSTNFASTAPCLIVSGAVLNWWTSRSPVGERNQPPNTEIALGMMAPSNTVEVFWEGATKPTPCLA